MDLDDVPIIFFFNLILNCCSSKIGHGEEYFEPKAMLYNGMASL